MTTWTIAYRKRTANRFRRVPGIALTWDEARTLAGKVAHVAPDLQVYYVPTAETETGEDAGNILVDSGKRVRMVETGDLEEFGDLSNVHSDRHGVVVRGAADVRPTCLCGWEGDRYTRDTDETSASMAREFARHLEAPDPVDAVDMGSAVLVRLPNPSPEADGRTFTDITPGALRPSLAARDQEAPARPAQIVQERSPLTRGQKDARRAARRVQRASRRRNRRR